MRAFRYIDVAGISPDQLNADGNIGKPGTSVWISFIAQGKSGDTNTAVGSPNRPFWGLAFFRDNTERLFFGKATGATSMRLAAQGGAQEFGHAISLGDKHFIVLRLDFNETGGHAATLFHNPDPLGRVPADDEALGVYTGATFEMSFNRVRLASGGGEGGTIDELRIGATWADVTPVPFTGLVNGDFEDEPFDRGWSVSTNVLEHSGFAPGSSTAAFLRRDADVTGVVNLAQNLPQWITHITPPRFDPVTGEPLRNFYHKTDPVWQVGFYTVVSDPGAAGNRSLNVLIGHDAPDPEGPSDVNSPQINFRINGDGGAQAYHGGGAHPDHPAGSGWRNVFPAGTFTFSPLNGPIAEATGFTEPTAYYLQFDGDYSGESPSYTVSARRAGEADYFAVSAPIQAWQYLNPKPGDGIIRVRFHGAVNSPYAVDSVHVGPFGSNGELPSGYTAWAEDKFGADAGNPAIAGPAADPDGDGIVNLIEYALGGDPTRADRSILPETSIVSDGGADYLEIVFGRNPDATGIAIDVLGSSDLLDWSATPTLQSSVESGGLIWETWRDSHPLSQNARRFMHVSIGISEDGIK